MSDKVRRAVRFGERSFLILSAGLVAVVAGVIACSDTPTATTAARSTTAPRTTTASVASESGGTRNAFRYVGEGHNALVDAVLRDVAKKRSKGSTKKLCKLAEESAIEYARTTAKNPGLAVKYVKSQDFCAASTGAAVRAPGKKAGFAEEYGLSPRATELLNYTAYFVGVSYSGAQLQSYLAPIEAAAMNELDWEEAQIVTSATSVAVSSLDYWIGNLSYWQSTLSTGTAYLRSKNGVNDVHLTPQYSFWSNAWDVAVTDIEGALSGGLAAKIAKTAIPEAALWTGGIKSLIRVIHLI